MLVKPWLTRSGLFLTVDNRSFRSGVWVRLQAHLTQKHVCIFNIDFMFLHYTFIVLSLTVTRNKLALDEMKLSRLQRRLLEVSISCIFQTINTFFFQINDIVLELNTRNNVRPFLNVISHTSLIEWRRSGPQSIHKLC